VRITQRAGRIAATCTATPEPRLRPWTARRAGSTSGRRAAQSKSGGVGDERLLAGLAAARAIAAVIHQHHRARPVRLLDRWRERGDLFRIPAEIDHECGALHGRQDDDAFEARAVGRREGDVLEAPPCGRLRPRAGRARIEDEPLLAQPHERRDGEIGEGRGEEEDLQDGEGGLSAAGPRRP
jgi:hypothetical protein